MGILLFWQINLGEWIYLDYPAKNLYLFGYGYYFKNTLFLFKCNLLDVSWIIISSNAERVATEQIIFIHTVVDITGSMIGNKNNSRPVILFA